MAERADGQVLTFTPDVNGNWLSDTDVDLKLVQNGQIWTLTDHTGTVETYQDIPSGTEALLQTIVSRDGYTRTLYRDASNLLVRVADSYGRQLTFFYNQGLLSQVGTAGSLVLTYNYTSSGITPGRLDQLASVTYDTTPITKQVYSYVNNYDLASITDENGNVFASWTYDSQHRATSSQHAGGAGKVTISYDSDTQRTVTGPLGQQTVYTFQTLQGVPKVTQISRTGSGTVPAGTETFTYDSNGYMASKTDWNGIVTTYVNDSHGDPTSITEAVGTPQARTTAITYDATHVHLPDQIVAPGLTTTFTYDANGNPVTRTETDTTGNGGTRTWHYTYDATGHMLTMTDPRGAKTTYTYNNDTVATVTNAVAQTSKITSYNLSGLPLSMTDPNGVTTTFTYDVRDRLLSRTVDGATTTFTYDPAGNLTGITLPDGAQLDYTYDAAHRVTAVSNNVGDSIHYTLDANGDITQQQVEGGSTITKTQSAVFDSLGRMLQQIGAYHETTSYAYDANGNNIGVTDALNNATAQSFDGLNRLIKSVDPLSNATSYAYDAQDNLTSVTDPRNLATTYTYDGFGDVLTQTSPDTGTTTFTYDAMGNPVTQTDARGVETDRTFDALDRVTAETYPSSSGDNVTYTYDQGQYGIGHLTGFTDASGSTSFTYNARGDITSDTRSIGRRTFKTSYTYDLSDRLASITYPDGRTVDYARDAFGRVSGITLAAAQRRDRDDSDGDDSWHQDRHRHNGGSQTLISGVGYEPFGPVNSFTDGNGIKESLTYDQDYRLTNILAKGNKTIQNLTYAYDGVSDITSITDAAAGTDKDQHRRHGFGRFGGDDRGRGDDGFSLSQSFTYDADMRLLTAAGAYGTQTYAYDADGNRTSFSATAAGRPEYRDGRDHNAPLTGTYAYAQDSNRLLGITGAKNVQYSYTANGNLERESDGYNVRQFVYDVRNRNSAIQAGGDGDGSAHYLYNALGERVQKSGGDHDDFGDKTDFIYDEQGHLIAETQGGRIAKEYVYLGSLPVAELAHNQIYYIHDDHLGQSQKLTDAHQRVVWSRTADPFGNTFAVKGDDDFTNLRFPGQYHDSESGLDYNGFRFYNPAIGRYTQSDPIGLLGGINTYAYTGNNPVNAVDPEGLWQVAFAGGFGYGGRITFGYNSGQFNLSGGIGYAQGFSFSYNPYDTGPSPSGYNVGFITQTEYGIGRYFSGGVESSFGTNDYGWHASVSSPFLPLATYNIGSENGNPVTSGMTYTYGESSFAGMNLGYTSPAKVNCAQ